MGDDLASRTARMIIVGSVLVAGACWQRVSWARPPEAPVAAPAPWSLVPLGAEGAPAVRVFTDGDGLPQNTVNSLRMDGQGYLWAGTDNGAAYYDGRRWIPFPLGSAEAADGIEKIGVALDGGLWFATRETGLY